MVAQKITRLRALDNERESIHKQKMKGSTKFKFGLHVFLTTQTLSSRFPEQGEEEGYLLVGWSHTDWIQVSVSLASLYRSEDSRSLSYVCLVMPL